MVRRPLLHGAIFYSLPVIIMRTFCEEIMILSGLVMVILYLFMKIPTRKTIIILCLFFYVAGAFNVFLYLNKECEFLSKEGDIVFLEGKVKSLKIKEKDNDKISASITLKNDNKQLILVRSFSNDCYTIKPGQRIKISGKVEIPQERSNPRSFDYRAYLESIGIHVIINAETIEITNRNCGLNGRLYNFKSEFLDYVEENTDSNTAAFINGIMFGDKNNIDQDILSQFQKNGTAHILAVSGLHVGIIYGFISKIWPFRKRYCYILFVCVFLYMYCIFSDFSPSVVRASIMVILHLIAKAINRRYDLSSAAFAVGIVMVTLNPMTIYNTGFQMTFLAVLTMSLIMPYVKRLHNGLLTGSMAVWLGLTPYTMYTFNYLSVGALVVNVPIILLAGILVPAGIVSFGLFVAGISTHGIDLIVLQSFSKSIVGLNNITCIEGITAFNVVSPKLFVVVIIYLALLAFGSEDGRLMILRKNYKTIVFMLLLIFAASFLMEQKNASEFDNAKVIFVDVGQGDSIHLRSDDSNYLFDGGGREETNIGTKVLKPYLLKNGVGKIDGAFVTHLHTDHYKGIAELSRENMVEHIYVSERYKSKINEICQETGLNKNHIHFIYAGQNLKLSNDVDLQILWPARSFAEASIDPENENDNSLIIKATVEGVSFLVTGDIDGNCEDELAGLYGQGLKSDILKVAHHGSKYSVSDSFYNAVNPNICVIQVGVNNYGHPSKEVVDLINSRHISLYRNDIQGAIGIHIDNGRIKNIVTVKNAS